MCGLLGYGQQVEIPRIGRMPALPQPYQMRDWKDVASGYARLVFDESLEGDHLPLASRKTSGTNYADCSPLYLDTYVGWNAHGSGSEAINVMPAVVTAAMFLDDESLKRDLAASIADFFNRKNGENVYLNGFSSKSGNDWWYDVMPNVYFYQLYDLMPEASPYFAEQFVSVADRWLQAVYQLGGKVYPWAYPNMNYRAFDLISGKPLDKGVKEPESAGSIAWILLQAYQKTGEKRYLQGAQMAMEFLNSLTSNPSYELQLPYGVQAAAKMNAILGCNYDLEKLFNWCFDRGPLRGWGCITGTWGGYDVSGLIGEANDGGNDYAFVMNGFQQMAALAPVVKYDKRYALAFAKWALNNANASGLFYRTGLPEKNQEATSYAWSKQYDPQAVIPFESIKEKWNGVSPLAMGDALRGQWAATNLSLYSGSSVGYLAAVVAKTDVEAILQLDLNRTDFGSDDLPTYLYYNPYGEIKQVTLDLPAGNYKIYDAITESFLTGAVSGKTVVAVPAGGVCLVTLVPAAAEVRRQGNKLYAGSQIIDYHYGYDYTPSLRIKNLSMQNSQVLPGSWVTAVSTLENSSGTPVNDWFLNGEKVSGQSGNIFRTEAPAALGEYCVKLVCSDNGRTATDSVVFRVVEKLYDAPEIGQLVSDTSAPAGSGTEVHVTARLKEAMVGLDYEWTVSAGELTGATNDSVVRWRLPDAEGVFRITCKAANLSGSSSAGTELLVRRDGGTEHEPLLYFPLDGNLTDYLSGQTSLNVPSGAAYTEGRFGSALSLEGTGAYAYLPNSEELNFTEAVALALWVSPKASNGKEQFIVSHGSWQDRYKLSLNPDMTLRWTVKTSGGIADLDYPVKLVPGKLLHVTALYTGFSAELYIDGRLIAYKLLNGTIGTTDKDFTLGAMNTQEMEYNFTGLIDELRIYDAPLSPSQVRKLPTLFAGGSGIGESTTDRIRFYGRDGVIVTDFEGVEIRGVYSLVGKQVENAGLDTGTYLVRYVHGEQQATAKVFVR